MNPLSDWSDISENLRNRLLMLATSLDAFLFALICLGNVKQGECASSAAWDCLLSGKWQGWFVKPIDAIFYKGHCRDSWEWQDYLYQSKTTP